MTEEGEIFINGRKIDELTLNSKSLFKGSKKVLLENLPYFTVKELKVFERPHVEKVMRKEHDDNPEYVMDVNLKNQYSTSTMANADAGGGTFSHLLQQENEATIAVSIGRERTMENFQQRPFSLTLSLPFFYQYEHLDYQRGAIDTLGRHRMFVVNPSLRVRCKEWTGWFGMSTSSPGMMNLIPYRDTRNPLSISEGNPALKNNRSLQASIDWNFHPKQDKDGKRTTSNSYAAGSSFKYHLRSVAQGATYAPVTSAYTYRPENVKGNWSWNTKVHLLGELRWRRTWGHRESSPSISAYDYRYGVIAQQTIPAWNTSINVDATMNSRRGQCLHHPDGDEGQTED